MSDRAISDVTKKYLEAYRAVLDCMIERMTEAELTDSISHNFIVQMIPHHRAAIEMSKNLLKYTTCIPLQDIAKRIITEQTESIRNMEAALKCCSLHKNTRFELRDYNRRMDDIMVTMFTQMGSTPACNDINADFIREMIPHHEGAIRMSKNALEIPIDKVGICRYNSYLRDRRKGRERL